MLRTTLLFGAVLLTAATAPAEFVLFSNVGDRSLGYLDPGTLDTSTTYAGAGPDTDGFTEWATSFVVHRGFPARPPTLPPMTLVAGAYHRDGLNQIEFRLLPDDGGRPGAIPLADVRFDDAPTLAEPGNSDLIFAYPDPLTPIVLARDARYWLALRAVGSGRFGWFGNGTGTAGDTPFASRTAPDGVWTVATGGPSPGFAILLKTAVPEPSSIGLLLTGLAVLGTARHARRRTRDPKP